MGRRFQRTENGREVLRRNLWGALTRDVAVGALFLLSFAWTREASAAPPDGVTMIFENRMEAFLTSDRVPLGGTSNIALHVLPGDSPLAPAVVCRTPASRNHCETLRASGKVLVAGGVGKRGIVFSAELYEPATDTWLARSQVSTGRGQSSTALPNYGRMLAWWGIVIPF